MKFTINTVTKCSGRLGLLSGLERLPNLTLQTPALVAHTKGGSIPHLSKEATQYLSHDACSFLQLSVSNTMHMQEAIRATGATIAEFIARQDSATLLVIRDPSEAQIIGVPERESVPIFTRFGRRNFAVEEYMKLVESFRPDAYIPLCDADTDATSSRKREQKSLDRTEKFVEQCLQWHRKSDALQTSSIIAPVVGGRNPKLREKCIEFLRTTGGDEFGGYLIDGLHLYGPAVARMERADMVSIVSDVCKQLPAEKVRFCFGAFDPRLVLELVMAGVDVFDTSYVFVKAAQEHRALVFSFDVASPLGDTPVTELDTTDARWEEDFEPLLPGCTCHTCRKSSRAYLHHLHNTREMLAPILLMIHNMHHYTEFFKAIRQHVASDTLAQLLEHLTRQTPLPPYVPKEEKKQQTVPPDRKDAAVEDDDDKLNKKQRGMECSQPTVMC